MSDFITLWTAARQAPLPMGFSRQEYWSGLPCTPPRDLPNPGIESLFLVSPALAGRFCTTSTTWEAHPFPKTQKLMAWSIHAKGGISSLWWTVGLGQLHPSPACPVSMATASGPLSLSVPPPLIPTQLPPPYHPEPEMSSFLISQLLPETPGLLWRRLWDIFYNLLLLFSHSVVCSSLRPHGLQQGGLACPSLSFWVCSKSCPLSRWCHPTISSSVAPFSSSPQSFPASGSFPMSWLFTSVHQSIRASASISVLPGHIQCWFPLGLTGLVSSQGTLGSLL